MEFEDIRKDIAAFADDDQDVEIDESGYIVFVRAGKEVTCQLVREESGAFSVERGGQRLPYKKFLSRDLAQLDIFAQRLLEKREPIQSFIDGPAKLDRTSGTPKSGTGMELLAEECSTPALFASRVLFVTGDAGHGKTALLREYQARQARAFMDGQSPFLFWHVDLQGRQLLRLSEALMGDLGALRVMGIYMPSIVRLMRHGLLVLGIDGFDELAAEQGSADALTSLAYLVREMDESGTIVAASRRTFFDTEDYLQRAGMLRQKISASCEFDQLQLLDWTRGEVTSFFSRIGEGNGRLSDPDHTYEAIKRELAGEEGHPLLTRPFLVSQMALAIQRYDVDPRDFIRGMEDPLKGVASVVKAFVEREVSDKWRNRLTGEPYLTVQQHMKLLEAIAEEMWEAQRDRLELGTIETITAILLDEWGTPLDRRRQVFEMVRMHVLLTIPPEGDSTQRWFGHREFRDYFSACALSEHVRAAISEDAVSGLGRFLATAQLSDSMARYSAGQLGLDRSEVLRAVEVLGDLVGNEWRPSHLQANAGTFLPCLLDGLVPTSTVEVDAKIVYSSLVFEGTRLRDITFRKGTFLRTGFSAVDWERITFEECEFEELAVDTDSVFQDVRFSECRFTCVILREKGAEIRREYAPSQIHAILGQIGITVGNAEESPQEADVEPAESETRQLVQRFLRVFRRATAISEGIINLKFHSDKSQILDYVIPTMAKHGLLEKSQWRGRGNQNRWILTRRLEDILKSGPARQDAGIREFWSEVDNQD